jgi:hypothetical protein
MTEVSSDNSSRGLGGFENVLARMSKVCTMEYEKRGIQYFHDMFVVTA